MPIRIDELPITGSPNRAHAVPAMKDGLTVQLTVDQILNLLTGGATQDANKVFAGPVSGGAAAPTFRLVDLVDLPGPKPVTKATGTYTALETDHLQFWRCTGAVTINLTAAATLGEGWALWVRANGGAVTIDPNSTEQINGSATALSLPDGQEVLIVCTGSAFFTMMAGAGPGGTVVTLADAQTLTNKTLTSPTVNTPTLVLKQGTSPTPTAEGDIQWDTDDDHFVVGNGSASLKPGKPPTVQVFTGSGTWTKPAGLHKVFVQVVGPGGGGAGATGGSSQASLGGGGGAGAYGGGWLDASSLASTVAVTVGTGGAGGAGNLTPQSGSAGSGASSFGAHITAGAGSGGGALTAGSSAVIVNGGSGGTAGTGGNVNAQGGAGGGGIRMSGTAGSSGGGGSSHFAGGGRATSSADQGGDSGSLGSGGGGATSFTSAQRAGGNGGDGIVIVTEFY